ncbi:esterase/lipase family protein [Streptomyces rhizosphaerihabitans]|uniref:esterase/lipase family protein n=1 Tax=Streptomyces rhizosphaerihabitans TaxID=1266770 RepID=UPI0021BF87E3|nr:alpha/beta fold hydrolase [Streptomyces rhizosphaerihabitans]MCT9003733.1 alpha/beta fold hydrolase [Streptomyces rhizosphaerihabitans]
MAGDVRLGVVMVHGLFSGPEVWGPLQRLVKQDPELGFVDVLTFGYETGVQRLSPLRVFPSIDTIADSLREYLATEAGKYEQLVLVTHSQGGLVVQRYLARMLHDGRGQELARIQRVVMLACPNNGSELFLSLRKRAFGSRHPQEKELRPLNDRVTGTLRTIMRDVVTARTVTDRTCPIPFSVYAGTEDGVVRPESAQAVFPEVAALPGDHSSILKAQSSDHRTFTTLKRLLFVNPVRPPTAMIRNRLLCLFKAGCSVGDATALQLAKSEPFREFLDSLRAIGLSEGEIEPLRDIRNQLEQNESRGTGRGVLVAYAEVLARVIGLVGKRTSTEEFRWFNLGKSLQSIALVAATAWPDDPEIEDARSELFYLSDVVDMPSGLRADVKTYCQLELPTSGRMEMPKEAQRLSNAFCTVL